MHPAEPAGSGQAFVPDDVIVYRLVKGVKVEDDRLRPMSSEFSDSSDGSGMSVVLKDEMDAAGVSWQQIQTALWPQQPDARVCAHTAGYYRALGQEIFRAPISEFPGHALVRDAGGRRGPKTKSLLALNARWAAEFDENDATRGTTDG